jgi:outer membrane lipoprotein-sorting protein
VGADYTNSYNRLSKDDQAKINRINRYFDSIRTFKSNFIQFNENDSRMSEGVIHIEKPDKIRFEYTNPFKTLFIKNKGVINYYDIDMDELVVVPQSVNPVFELFSKQDNLAKLNSEILSVRQSEDNNIIVETRLKFDDNAMGIMYIFDREITALVGLNIDNGDKIELSFFNAEVNSAINKKTFVFDNPRLFDNRKRNR